MEHFKFWLRLKVIQCSFFNFIRLTIPCLITYLYLFFIFYAYFTSDWLLKWSCFTILPDQDSNLEPYACEVTSLLTAPGHRDNLEESLLIWPFPVWLSTHISWPMQQLHLQDCLQFRPSYDFPYFNWRLPHWLSGLSNLDLNRPWLHYSTPYVCLYESQDWRTTGTCQGQIMSPRPLMWTISLIMRGLYD